MSDNTIAVLIPCYNESATIREVIGAFKQQLPDAQVYVYDNGSTDQSVSLAKEAGAIVKHVSMRGKGQVVRRMFADINADSYIMVDGDNTYDPKCVHAALKMMQEDCLDMVVCTRNPVGKNSFRPGHALGNKIFNKAVNILFASRFTDIFSGFRIFSYRFVKSFPIISNGFEIEMEMTIHALELGLPTAEISCDYQERPPGSVSKLNTIKDGLRISRTLFLFFFYVRPTLLFGSLFLIFLFISLLFGLPVILHFFQTGLVPRLPTAVLAASLGIIAGLCLVCGLILDSISQSRLEMKRCWYLLVSNRK